MSPAPAHSWPEGKRFAFTIFDDSDGATVANVAPVYRVLRDCGFRTTKSCWPLEPAGPAAWDGDSCEDPAALRWLLELQRDGFEIGYHLAARDTSPRAHTQRALAAFRAHFGHDPHTLANHAANREGIYWGDARLSGWRAPLYNVLTWFQNRGRFRGHRDGDPLFWGDLCRARVRYVRNFVFAGINTLAACPFMPYHDAQRPYVNAWFASSEGGNLKSFTGGLAEARQERLEAEGGACIMYTHFGKGFAAAGQANARVAELLRRLSRRPGWFVPVATLLDYLAERNGPHELGDAERRRLERRWLWQKLFLGST